ncbi:MAG TPA: alpha/beta hydrolase [Bryobacteraceae bacterium]|nr:alpha/beta hydrolase [Bryobacteraceae bacterium]
MNHPFARRGFLRRVATGSGALALASTQRATAEEKYLTAAKLDNFALYYEIHGDGPPVVFAHGAGGTHMSWWQQVPVLSQKYKCITIDHRTFGYSRDTPGGPGRRAFVQDLAGLLDHLGIQKTALVGQSMGGTTVLGFASAHPDRVSALVMSDTTGGYTNSEIAEIRRKLAPAPASIDRAFAPDFSKREPARAFLYREINALTAAANPAPPAGAPGPSTDISPVLAKKIPVLFIVGEQDQLIPPPIIEAMHKQMLGSQLVKVPGAGHSVYWERPDDYNRILMEFLQKHVTA